MLKSIRGLRILYDNYVTESGKIMSLSIDLKLLPYCTRVFSYIKVILKVLSTTENILLIDTKRYSNILMH